MSKLPESRERFDVRTLADELIQWVEEEPQETFEPLRSVIFARRSMECPPLALLDLIGVLTVEAYHRFLSDLHPLDSPIPTRESSHLEQVGLEILIHAAPELAVEAGLVPPLAVPPAVRVAYTVEQYGNWSRNVASPAMVALMNRRFRANMAEREDRVAMRVLKAVTGDSLKSMGEDVRRSLHKALVSLGWRQPKDPPLTRDEVFLFMKAFVDHPLERGDLMHRGRDGVDRLGWRQLTRELGRALQDPEAPVVRIGRKQKIGQATVRSLAHEPAGSEDQTLTTVELLEIRDHLDRAPSIRAICARSTPDAKTQARVLAELRQVIDVLDRRDDPSRKAAILYVWLADRLGSVPGGRKHLAESYGVSEKQLRDREPGARADLAALRLKSG